MMTKQTPVPPVKIKRWQYIQLFGLTTMMFLSLFCVLMIIGTLLFSVYLVRNNIISWIGMSIFDVLLITITTYWLPKLFRYLYLRKRLQRIRALKKIQRDDEENEDNKKVWYRRFSPDLIGIGLVLIFLISAGIGIYSIISSPKEEYSAMDDQRQRSPAATIYTSQKETTRVDDSPPPGKNLVWGNNQLEAGRCYHFNRALTFRIELFSGADTVHFFKRGFEQTVHWDMALDTVSHSVKRYNDTDDSTGWGEFYFVSNKPIAIVLYRPS